MKIIYFEDTDTAHFEFQDKNVIETQEISENIYIDVDKSGNLVSMTVEHADKKANIQNFSFNRIRDEKIA